MGSPTQGFQAGFGLMSAHEGKKFAKKGFKIQKQAEIASNNFNKAIIDIDTERKSAQLGRQLRRILGTQRVAAAASGLATGSKSQLMLMNEAMTRIERQDVQMRNSARYEKDAMDYKLRQRLTEIKMAKNKMKSDFNKQMFQGLLSAGGAAFTQAQGAGQASGTGSIESGQGITQAFPAFDAGGYA